MFGFIFGIILVIASIVIAAVLASKTVEVEYERDYTGRIKVNQQTGEPVISQPAGHPYKKFSGLVVLGGIFLGALFTFFGCIANVGTGKTGVVTTFGKIENYTLESGFHLKAPWRTVTEIDTTINEITINTPAYTNDSQTVELEITIQYRISTAETFSVVADNGIKNPQNVLESKLENRIMTVAKNVVATKKAEDLLTSRSELVSELATQIDSFNDEYYVIIAAVNLTNIDFTDEYEAAVAAKVAQKQALEKALIEQEQALKQAENEKKIAETEAQAAAAVAKIQAEAEYEVVKIQSDSAEYQGKKQNAITLQALASVNGWTVIVNETSGVSELFKADGTQVTASELVVGTQKYIEYCYTQTWNGILPDTYVGDGSVSSILIGGTN